MSVYYSMGRMGAKHKYLGLLYLIWSVYIYICFFDIFSESCVVVEAESCLKREIDPETESETAGCRLPTTTYEAPIRRQCKVLRTQTVQNMNVHVFGPCNIGRV